MIGPDRRLELAIEVALIAHGGQVDKFGEPYILHPLRVMLRGRTDDERIVGVLHDVLEDAPGLREGLVLFSDEQLEALRLLTRTAGEDYWPYLARLKPNDLARRVKVYDLSDNLDPARVGSISPSLAGRYARAMVYLLTYEPDCGSPVPLEAALENGAALADTLHT